MIGRTLEPLLSKVVLDYAKMAFVSGPRQVGKTTLAKEFQRRFSHSLYFNWDVITDQKRLAKDPYFFEKETRDPNRPFLVVLDEIHKYARWRNYLKGAYDRYRDEFRFLVTGSGRLDLFRKAGDSLLGRYVGLPIFPLSLAELAGVWNTWALFKEGLRDPPGVPAAARQAYDTLFNLSGFPEPFLRGETSFYNIWFQDRKSLLIRQDIRDATRLREISLLEILSHLIPDRVGTPLSLNALREDVAVAHETVRDWVLLLERFYYLFRILPFAGSLTRSIKKEPKVYLYEWVEIHDAGRRFENMVALHLLKAVQSWRASGEGDIGLHYVRDKEKREADFLITERKRPVCLVECKHADEAPSPSLLYFQEKLAVPVAVQLVHSPGVCKKVALAPGTLWVISADRWLGLLV